MVRLLLALVFLATLVGAVVTDVPVSVSTHVAVVTATGSTVGTPSPPPHPNV
jgi:hypothetical protein